MIELLLIIVITTVNMTYQSEKAKVAEKQKIEQVQTLPQK